MKKKTPFIKPDNVKIPLKWCQYPSHHVVLSNDHWLTSLHYRQYSQWLEVRIRSQRQLPDTDIDCLDWVRPIRSQPDTQDNHCECCDSCIIRETYIQHAYHIVSINMSDMSFRVIHMQTSAHVMYSIGLNIYLAISWPLCGIWHQGRLCASQY